MSLELTVLGSGTRVLLHERSMAGYAVRTPEQFLLLDCGDGVIRRGLAAGLPMLQVDAILFSHFHLDHIADLPPLLWALHGEGHIRAERPLQLFGPRGLQKLFDGLIALYGDWILRIPCEIVVREISDEHFRVGSWQVRAYCMEHGLPANGYRLVIDNNVLAYTGDTGPCEAVVALARHAQVFITECSFPNGQESATHLTAGEVGRLAAAAQCQRVLLAHLYPDALRAEVVSQVREYFSGAVELSYDLQRLML